MARFSKRHYERLANGGPDHPGETAQRVAQRLAGEQANREMMAKFAPLTPDNIGPAMAWQETRIRELQAPLFAARGE